MSGRRIAGGQKLQAVTGGGHRDADALGFAKARISSAVIGSSSSGRLLRAETR